MGYNEQMPQLASVFILILALTARFAEQRAAAPSSLDRVQKEEFLLKASIVSERELTPVAIRLRLDDGKQKHDAAANLVAVHNPGEDIRLNLAAYELDKALDLEFVEPAVERSVRSQPAVVVWWVDDLAMSELDRRRKSLEPTDPDRWNKQMQVVRLFDELISNAYRNTSPSSYLTTLWDNLMITTDWQLWMIDHKRAFRPIKQLENPESLTQCDRLVLRRLRGLNKEMLKQRLEQYLSPEQLEALEVRRQLLVKHFDDQIAKKGESAVLYDLLPRR